MCSRSSFALAFTGRGPLRLVPHVPGRLDGVERAHEVNELGLAARALGGARVQDFERVVADHAGGRNRHRGVLGRRRSVVHCHRCVVDVGHRDRDQPGGGHRQRRARHVVQSVRRVVHWRDGDRDVGAPRSALPVGDRVGEVHRAVEVRCRRVDDVLTAAPDRRRPADVTQQLKLSDVRVLRAGYGMYYVWVIRHLPGDRYTVPVFEAEHDWTRDPQADYWRPRGIEEA